MVRSIQNNAMYAQTTAVIVRSQHANLAQPQYLLNSKITVLQNAQKEQLQMLVPSARCVIQLVRHAQVNWQQIVQFAPPLLN
jgi:hypothetical protein